MTAVASDRAVLGVVAVSDLAAGSGRRLPGALTANRLKLHQKMETLLAAAHTKPRSLRKERIQQILPKRN